MKTDKDMQAEVIRALDEGTPDGYLVYDVRGIVAACHKILIDSTDPWDLGLIDSDLFWQIVEQIDTRNRVRRIPAVSGHELLNAMIANYVACKPGKPRSEEHAGRFETLFHAVKILYPHWTEERVEEWLIEHIDELRLAAIED